MRATVLLVTAFLVVGAGAPFAVASPASDTPAASATESTAVQDDPGNDSENETAPGARLAGVVNVQEAEVEGEVEQRSFGLQVAATASNASKAAVVARQAQSLDERLAELRERKQSLEAARENGTISAPRYRAEMAALAARISTLERLSNATAEVARGVPADVLVDHDVNVTAVEQLRTAAGDLSGPEVTAIARNVTGATGNATDGPPLGLPGGPSDDGPLGLSGEDNDSEREPGETPGPVDDSTDDGDESTSDDRVDVPGGDDEESDGSGENGTETEDGDDVVDLPEDGDGNGSETGTTTDGLLAVDWRVAAFA